MNYYLHQLIRIWSIDGCANCENSDALWWIPRRYTMPSSCANCYREYYVLNWEGQSKYDAELRQPVKRYKEVGRKGEADREHQRMKHAGDMVQPWKGGGHINPDFVKLYPKQAKKMFHPEEVKKVRDGFKGDGSKENPSND